MDTNIRDYKKYLNIIAKEYIPKGDVDLVEIVSYFAKFKCSKKINIAAINKSKQNVAVKSNKANVKFLTEKTVRRKNAIPAYKLGITTDEQGNEIPWNKWYEDPNKGFKGTKLSLNFTTPPVALTVLASGVILAACKRTPEDGPLAFLKLVKAVGADKVFGEESAKSANSAEKRKEKAAKVANARNPLTNSWNAKKNGFYVRPGPNKKPRFYPIPENKSLVRAKVVKAYQNAGVSVPAHVKSALNITNSVKAKSPAKGKPTGFNNQSHAGHYVKPNKQGKPQWYKIPSGKEAAKPGVIKAYEKHSVAIPAHIKSMFKITNTNVNKVELKSPKFNLSPSGTLRINGKQAERYNKEYLLKIARNKGIASVSNSNKISKIRNAIIARLGLKPRANSANSAFAKELENMLKK